MTDGGANRGIRMEYSRWRTAAGSHGENTLPGARALLASAAKCMPPMPEHSIPRLENPDSMQVRTAYVTDEGAVCLEIAAQNGAGGMSVSRVVYFTPDWKGAKRLREHWLDEGGMGGSGSADVGWERLRCQPLGPCLHQV